jgi:hypothetical protein
MMGASATDLPTWLILGALVSGLLLVLFGTRSKQTKSDLAASVVALQGEDTVNKGEIARLKDQDAAKDAALAANAIQMADLRSAIRTLERIVTGVDVIIAGFELVAGPERGPEVRQKLELVRANSEQTATTHSQRRVDVR